MLDLILNRVPSFMADQRHPRGARGLFSDHFTCAVVGMRACMYEYYLFVLAYNLGNLFLWFSFVLSGRLGIGTIRFIMSQ